MAAGADDFLPVLIYVVIHANPPQLASNLEYIQRFRMHSRMASESAYFFTQLVSSPFTSIDLTCSLGSQHLRGTLVIQSNIKQLTRYCLGVVLGKHNSLSQLCVTSTSRQNEGCQLTS